MTKRNRDFAFEFVEPEPEQHIFLGQYVDRLELNEFPEMRPGQNSEEQFIELVEVPQPQAENEVPQPPPENEVPLNRKCFAIITYNFAPLLKKTQICFHFKTSF
jgi:hypothetical protein